MLNPLLNHVSYTDSLTISFNKTGHSDLLYLILFLLILLVILGMFLWIQNRKMLANSTESKAPTTIFYLPIYNELCHLIEENKGKAMNEVCISETKWLEIFQALDENHNKFATRFLEENQNLKTEDIHFCCLLKMEFKYSEMAILLGRTPNMMYKRKDSICKRLALNDTQTLESFINNY